MEYIQKKTIKCADYIIRVHSPVISQEEKNKRMKAISKAAERLLKGVKP